VVFRWLRTRRRREILEADFDPRWRAAIEANVAHWCWLDDDERGHLEELVQVFIAEKNWEGAGGLEMTPEIQATVAADACLLILSLEHEFYRGVESIVVYPTAVRPPPRQLGTFEVVTSPMEVTVPRLGEAWKGGPLILAWDAVLRGARNAKDGVNVVFHEFAHKLDMLTGNADGVPPLTDAVTHAKWVSALQAEYDRLERETEEGRRSFLDRYALTNGAEFFAVATEHFFEQPRKMREDHAEMYEVLSAFYRQDPARRRRRA
jgi:Mlc titration factor MtfA (ptsG expression regulator)